MSDAALKMRAKALLATASNAAAQLESSVRELVTMRAWTLLGYENFAEMWKAEAGYACPSYVKIIATVAMADEGMNTTTNSFAKNGHTTADVGIAIGWGVQSNSSGRDVRSGSVKSILTQYAHGVPLDKIRTKIDSRKNIIKEHGKVPYVVPSRRRPTNQRVGKGPNDTVHEGFVLPRHEADKIAEIARQSNVTKSEIYRQAVAEYLARHRASR